MLDSLRGTIVAVDEDSAVLECGGIAAFRLRVPAATLRTLQRGADAHLFCHLLLREEQFHLYGFGSAQEREAFLVLLTVSGLGPEKARAIVGALQPHQIARAVAEGDARRFQLVRGVGTRLAERLVLELKDKLEHLAQPAAGSVAASATAGRAVDLIAALSHLGYPQTQAAQAAADVVAAAPDAPIEQLLKQALRVLQRPS